MPDNDSWSSAGEPFLGSQAADLGYTTRLMRQALREGAVRRVLRNVYVDTTVPDSIDLRVAALHLVMPRHAVLFGTTAMWAMGIDAWQPEERFTPTPGCLVPHGASRSTVAGVKTVEGYLPATDVVEHRGLRVTHPVRTTVDALRRLRRPFAMAAADAMAHAGWVQRHELDERIARLRGYRGVIQARSLVRLVDARIEWPGESWTRLRLVDCGLPVPEPQVWVIDVKGRRARLDLGYEQRRVGCEYDGKEVHTLEEDRRADRNKRRWLHDSMDWRVAVTDREGVFGRWLGFELEIANWLGYDNLHERWW